MNKRYIPPRRKIRLTSDAQPRTSDRDDARPVMQNNARHRPPRTNSQTLLSELDLSYVAPDGTILFWTGLYAFSEQPDSEDQ